MYAKCKSKLHNQLIKAIKLKGEDNYGLWLWEYLNDPIKWWLQMWYDEF